MPVTIRQAVVSDLPAIRQVAEGTWPVAYAGMISAAQIAYMLDMMYSMDALHEQLAKGHIFHLAEDGGRPVGFAGFEHHYTDGRTRLHKLYVLPALKGTGLGRRLVERVVQATLRSGDRAIELNVNKRNPAVRFYHHLGFTIERDEVLDIGQGFVMDDHVMLLQLTGPTTG